MKIPRHTSFEAPVMDQIDAARRAARLIPPAFPLAATVAVNPYLGHADETLAESGARLARAGGMRVTLPRTYFRAAFAKGDLSRADLEAVLPKGMALAELEIALKQDSPAPTPLPTVADLAAKASGIDWPEIVQARIGVWAAGYFDQGQALWPAPQGRNAYDAWRGFARHDLTPEIAGLAGFCTRAADAPDTATLALVRSADALGLDAEALESAAHCWLVGLGGWAQVARWKLWQAELDNGSDETLTDLLAIRMLWDVALLAKYRDKIGEGWAQVVSEHACPALPDRDLLIDIALQAALEHAHQRRLAQLFTSSRSTPSGHRPKLQAAFCIDVRSERYRRALESCDVGIQTVGFAGFFGLLLAHKPLGACAHEPHVPVLLRPTLQTQPGEDTETDASSQIAARAARAWGRFKLAAISSFAFVEATGPLYLAKLARDALGMHGLETPEPAPAIHGLGAAERVASAENILRAMGLTRNFAPIVLLIGHGAQVTNNAHASALQCGACGGHSGEVSARAVAGLLNDPAVRAGLAQAGIEIPSDTLFHGGLHDTVSDKISVFEPLETRSEEIRTWLDQASSLCRAERGATLPHAGEGGADLPSRALDWAEPRPEWGLAGCAAFIAAPRAFSRSRDLQGRAFLHDYDPDQDAGFKVLELILTAPVVVANWISLQYYGSVTAPDHFGAGNKMLHNVVGGFGVFEGAGHAPRTGLAWQSVHDGERLIHEPLRLCVLLRAPEQAVSDILARHPQVRALFDNGWLSLILLDEAGQMSQRYVAGTWCPVVTSVAVREVA